MINANVIKGVREFLGEHGPGRDFKARITRRGGSSPRLRSSHPEHIGYWLQGEDKHE